MTISCYKGHLFQPQNPHDNNTIQTSQISLSRLFTVRPYKTEKQVMACNMEWYQEKIWFYRWGLECSKQTNKQKATRPNKAETKTLTVATFTSGIWSLCVTGWTPTSWVLWQHRLHLHSPIIDPQRLPAWSLNSEAHSLVSSGFLFDCLVGWLFLFVVVLFIKLQLHVSMTLCLVHFACLQNHNHTEDAGFWEWPERWLLVVTVGFELWCSRT